jgi:hypothetical protein
VAKTAPKEKPKPVPGLCPALDSGLKNLFMPAVFPCVSAVMLFDMRSEVHKQWSKDILSARFGKPMGGKNKHLVGLVPIYACCSLQVPTPPPSYRVTMQFYAY